MMWYARIIIIIVLLSVLTEVLSKKCLKCKYKGKADSGKEKKKNKDKKAEHDKGNGCGVSVDRTQPTVLEEEDCVAVGKRDSCKTKFRQKSYEGDYEIERGCTPVNETETPVVGKNETVQYCSEGDNCNENLNNVTRCYLCNTFGIGEDKCSGISTGSYSVVSYCGGQCKKHKYSAGAAHYVLRECDPDCKEDSSFLGIVETYCCTGDLCNSASHVIAHVTALLTTACLVLLI